MAKKEATAIAIPKNSVSLKRFLKAPFINMPHIFGNMVYLNIKERDRFYEGA